MPRSVAEQIEDDLDWDEWMSLTDEQIDARVKREMSEYANWYNRLSLAGQITHRRRATLDNCRSARRLIGMPQCPQIIRETSRERLKAAQVRLLKIRSWRATGIEPGEA